MPIHVDLNRSNNCSACCEFNANFENGVTREYSQRGVAQLVARQFWELDAGSSSLPTPTNF